MIKFCPFCEKETKINKIIETEDMDIRGEIIPVERTFYRCGNCGEEFELASNDYDPFDTAYQEYRRRKGWLQPEEIKEFREKLGLTQQEFSEMLGIGIATLNRYENGALQTEAINSLISLCIADPQNLLRLIHAKKNSASDFNLKNPITELIRRIKTLDIGGWINESFRRFLDDVGYVTDAGKLNESYLSLHIEDNLSPVERCFEKGDYSQALSYITPLTEMLYSHQERDPIIHLVSRLIRNHEQLIMQARELEYKLQELEHKFQTNEEKAAKIRAAILSVNNLVLSSETEIETDLFDRRSEKMEFVSIKETKKI